MNSLPVFFGDSWYDDKKWKRSQQLPDIIVEYFGSIYDGSKVRHAGYIMKLVWLAIE